LLRSTRLVLLALVDFLRLLTGEGVAELLLVLLVDADVLLKMLKMELRFDFFADASEILRRIGFRVSFRRCGNDPK